MDQERDGSDPYLWLEDISSKKVTVWALKRDKLFRRELKPKFPKLSRRVARFYNERSILMVKVTQNGTFFLERRPTGYVIRLEDRIIANSSSLGNDYVFLSFYADERGERLAYFASRGEDYGTTRIIDVPSGKLISQFKGVVGDVVLQKDGGFYYVKSFRDQERTPDGVDAPASRIMKGKTMIFGKGIPSGEFINFKESNGYALISVGSWSNNEIYAGRIDEPSGWVKIFRGKGRNFISSPIAYIPGRGVLILSHDSNGNGRIFLGEKLIIGEREEPLLDAALVGSEIICHYLRDCASHFRVFGLDGQLVQEFEPSFRASMDVMSSNNDRAIVVGTSFGFPYAIYEYSNGRFKELERRQAAKVPVYEGFVKSKDKTRVHYFLLGKKNPKKILIYGYGGYSIPITPFYDPLYCVLLENGVSCVVSNLRGGSEYGEKWHNDGKMYKKQNVFDDYAAVIKRFKGQGAKVVAYGVSNGGLLVGTTITQNPSLVDGALIGNPVLDMMRFHRLFVGKLWIDEYGDPDKEKDRRYLLRYSPYHNVKGDLRYPRTLVYTSLHDDRVHPAHAFKFVAKLEQSKDHEVWLRVQTKGGHAGSSVKTKIEELSELAGFVVYSLGGGGT
jgi:prolyl oligopeptidase